MKDDEEIFESLIAGGIIGAALGALISKNEGEGATLGALAGAAILATFKASEKAKETKLPIYVEEKGNLYQLQAGESKIFIREINKPRHTLKQYFKLK